MLLLEVNSSDPCPAALTNDGSHISADFRNCKSCMRTSRLYEEYISRHHRFWASSENAIPRCLQGATKLGWDQDRRQQQRLSQAICSVPPRCTSHPTMESLSLARKVPQTMHGSLSSIDTRTLITTMLSWRRRPCIHVRSRDRHRVIQSDGSTFGDDPAR